MSRKMKDTDYAYAVARVRAKELTLLTEADVEQLVEADSYEAAMQKLSESGWGDLDGVTDYAQYLEAHFGESWEFLNEILDDVHGLDLLLVQNDMQNLKAALKSLITGEEDDSLYSDSTVYDTESIRNAVRSKTFGELPEFMQDAAQEAYEVLTTTANGQLSDTILDKATLTHILELGKESKSPVLKKIAERKVATANIKTALRCASTKKSADFVERSLAPCSSLSVKDLKEASQEGPEAVLAALENTPYEKGAEEFRTSTSAFEKWCDDLLMDCVQEARYTPFSVDPIIAYYIARDAEVKTARIILSAKKNNLSQDAIRERVRTLYV